MKIYFMGICGTAMGNVAAMLKEANHEIIGSDNAFYEPMKSVLENANIECLKGYSAKRLKEIKPDLVVIGNAQSRMNEEVEYLLSSKEIPFTSLAQLISEEVIKNRDCLVVSGTHGKTTTTSMSTMLLKQHYANCGYLIGGLIQGFKSGANLGSFAEPFVIEGDEYDTAFFDKRSKFIHYKPKVLIINNIEFDHADIFRDIIDVKRTFSHVRRIVSGNGLIIENADDTNIDSLENTPWVKCIKVGFRAGADLQIQNFKEEEDFTSFDLVNKFQRKTISWNLPAQYNARNAAMAIAGVASLLGKQDCLDIDISPLLNFKGVKRRQEILHKSDKVVIIEDFGHHPTAIKNTILSMRNKYAKRKIIACFEPRSNSSRTNVFQDDFANSLSLADEICIGKIQNLEKIPLEKRIDLDKMSEVANKQINAFTDNQELLKYIENTINNQESSCVIFFSNGSFDAIQHSDCLKI